MTSPLTPRPKPEGIPSSYIAAFAIFAAVVAYFGIGTLLSAGADDGEETAAEAANNRPLFTVLVKQVSQTNQTLTVTVAGRTEAGKRAIVRAETPGQVAATPALEGRPVEAGATLCRLETNSRDAVLSEARAVLAKTNADYNAALTLFEAGFSSDAGLKSARASLDGAKARLRQAEQDISNTEIVAPFNGVLAETLVEPGDFLPAGGACAVVADLSEIVIAGGLSARQAANLSTGDSALITVGNAPPFAAEVTFVAEVADPQTRAFRVELTAANARALSDGLNATALISAGQRKAALIPRNAIVFSDTGTLGVRTLDHVSDSKTGEVGFTPIELLSEADNGALVTGLTNDQHVIIRGQEYVREGSTVAFVSDDAAGD